MIDIVGYRYCWWLQEQLFREAVWKREGFVVLGGFRIVFIYLGPFCGVTRTPCCPEFESTNRLINKSTYPTSKVFLTTATVAAGTLYFGINHGIIRITIQPRGHGKHATRRGRGNIARHLAFLPVTQTCCGVGARAPFTRPRIQQ